MNRSIYMGRLTKDPEIRVAAASQMKVARFTIAVGRTRKKDNEPDADYIPLTAFGKLAEFAEKYLTKGSKILVEATTRNDNYTDRDGKKVYSYQFIANSIEFAESKRSASGSSSGAPSGSSPEEAERGSSPDGFMNIPEGIEEELPFS